MRNKFSEKIIFATEISLGSIYKRFVLVLNLSSKVAYLFWKTSLYFFLNLLKNLFKFKLLLSCHMPTFETFGCKFLRKVDIKWNKRMRWKCHLPRNLNNSNVKRHKPDNCKQQQPFGWRIRKWRDMANVFVLTCLNWDSK